MKNKTWIWICAAILVILAVILIWKPFGASQAQPAETPAATEEAVQQEVSAPTEEPQAQEIEETQEETGGILIEGDGEIEIIVPEGEGSGGF